MNAELRRPCSACMQASPSCLKQAIWVLPAPTEQPRTKNMDQAGQPGLDPYPHLSNCLCKPGLLKVLHSATRTLAMQPRVTPEATKMRAASVLH